MKGFSRTNLLYMRKWYLFYLDESGNVPQVVGQIESLKYKEILQIPWGHNREIMSRVRSLQAVAQTSYCHHEHPDCHPELVSGSHNLLLSIDSETSSE